MDLLLSALDLREVLGPVPVVELPGRPRGIQGVVFHQGEFVPVLAWEDLPGCPSPPAPPSALAVLRPRLGLPLETMTGMRELPSGDWREADEGDPASSWLGGVCRLEGRDFGLVDPDRLLAVLRRLREDR
jgi:chemotaxis signal transduction protein